MNKFLFLPILFLFAACEKEIEFNGKETSPLLVVNSFVQPDSVLKVEVSRSVFFLSNAEPRNVSNATITVFVNGENKGIMTYYPYNPLDEYGGAQHYALDYAPKVGDLIRYEVEVPEFGKVTAEDVVPQITEISSVETEMYAEDEWGSTSYKIRIRFQDKPNEKNYYRIVMYKMITCSQWDNDLQKDVVYDDPYPHLVSFDSDDMVFQNDPTAGVFTEEIDTYDTFPDDLIDGKFYTLTLTSRFASDDYRYGYGYGYGYKEIASDVYVCLQSISHDYYMYLQTRAAAEDAGDFGIFTEPVQVFSNIHGGIGILGTYSVSVHKVK
ncbi:MAG: DUF4249 domain-containing protein [Paludibacter sp.]|jgi:hypothetical protein|nr:DUF4249 domain-containing protein [Paludibacter sp.]